MDAELSSGLLIIGVTSTVLFEGGESTTELILLDLKDGSDFTLPVSDDQAVVIANHIEIRENAVAGCGEETLVAVPDVGDFAKNIGLSDDVGEVAFGEAHTPGEVETTPQF